MEIILSIVGGGIAGLALGAFLGYVAGWVLAYLKWGAK